MEDLPSSSESLVPNSRKTRKSNRPDLGDEDFQGLDSKKVDEYRKVLAGERLFNGQEDEHITPNMVEEDGVPFARGNMSYVLAGKSRGQWFAFKRSWIAIDDDRESYKKEIKTLQTLRESASWHIVQLIGYYTKPTNEGRLVLSPLAECTLEDYISQFPTPGRKLVVMRWFGCLAGALKNIHEQNIKHKDIKTKNILVHGENIIITDLGISNKFTERSTSLGDSPGSLTYMAPEVLDKGRRGRQQDVWSLVCCFIEMFSFITGFTISDFRKWCNPTEWRFNFNNDYDRVIAWLKHLRTRTTVEAHLALLDLLLSAFKKEPKDRPTASDLFDRLRNMGTFVGECCSSPRRQYGAGSEKFSLSLSTDLFPSVWQYPH
jgi:serine/threonine protein kinase